MNIPRLNHMNISGIGRIDLSRYQIPGGNFNGPTAPTPRPSNIPVSRPTAPPISTAPPQTVAPSPQRPAPTSNQVNLLTFGGDRKKVVETLIASGARGENPKVGFFGNVFRKIFGGTTTKKTPVGPNQTLTTKVRNKNFQVKELRLSTRDGGKTRHIDFIPGQAQVKDVGTVLAKGEVKRMFDQSVSRDNRGRTVINSNYFDPKTGRQLLRVTEASSKIDVTKFGTVESERTKNTFRQIEVLGADGKTNSRYTFDHTRRSYRFESLAPDGSVRSGYNLPRKMDFHGLVERLSTRGSTPTGSPFSGGRIGGFVGGGGGGRGEGLHVALH